MAKYLEDQELDGQLDVVSATATHIHVCSGQPTQYSEIAGLMLAEQALSGSIIKADGDVSGRKQTIPAQSAVPITNDGLASHVVLSDGVSNMLPVTTCTPQQLNAGGTVDIPAWDHEVRDPT